MKVCDEYRTSAAGANADDPSGNRKNSGEMRSYSGVRRREASSARATTASRNCSRSDADAKRAPADCRAASAHKFHRPHTDRFSATAMSVATARSRRTCDSRSSARSVVCAGGVAINRAAQVVESSPRTSDARRRQVVVSSPRER